MIEEHTVDGVVTDPPYGIGFKYNTHEDSPIGYGAWLWSVIEQCERICRPGSPVVIWQAMSNIRHFAGWFPRDFRLFAAAKNFVQMRNTALQHAFDPVVIWWTDGERYHSKTGGVNRDFHVSNSAKTVAETWALHVDHPCPRPLDTVEYIIKHLVRPEGTILDPFLGSGTTSVAARNLGRRCIGIEKDQKYVDVAVRRLKDAEGAGAVTEMRKQLAKTHKKHK